MRSWWVAGCKWEVMARTDCKNFHKELESTDDESSLASSVADMVRGFDVSIASRSLASA